MEGGNSPVFGSKKYFFKNQHGVSYELAKTEISCILLKDTVAEIEFGTHWAEIGNANYYGGELPLPVVPCIVCYPNLVYDTIHAVKRKIVILGDMENLRPLLLTKWGAIS